MLHSTPSGDSTFPLKLRTELIKLLEPEDRMHNNNWKQVANHLKLPYREIRYLEDQKGTRYGPMEQLLLMWEQENKTLREFTELMKEIRRFDVIARIENYERLFGSSPSSQTIIGRVRETFRRIQTPQNDLNRIRTSPVHRQVHPPQYIRQDSASIR